MTLATKSSIHTVPSTYLCSVTLKGKVSWNKLLLSNIVFHKGPIAKMSKGNNGQTIFQHILKKLAVSKVKCISSSDFSIFEKSSSIWFDKFCQGTSISPCSVSSLSRMNWLWTKEIKSELSPAKRKNFLYFVLWIYSFCPFFFSTTIFVLFPMLFKHFAELLVVTEANRYIT